MKRADIQGMRAIAVVLVMLFHFETRLRGGYLGVDMFFVISGFVIASSTLREIERTNSFSWKAFLQRRARRVLPGLAVVSAATALLSMLLLSPFGPQQETAKMLLSAATYTSNFVLMPQSYFSLDPKSNPLLHLWSLAVEEQFYVVWPIAVISLVGLRKHLRRGSFQAMKWLLILSALLISCWMFLSFTMRGGQVANQSWFAPLNERSITPAHFAFFSPFTRAWEFVAGVVVASLVKLNVSERVKKAGSLMVLCGAAMVVFGLAYATRYPEVQHGGNWSTNSVATLAVVLGTSVWVFGGAYDNVLSRVIAVKPMSILGDSSYAIYLLHWPIWVLLITSFAVNRYTQCAALLISLALGWLQYRLIEEPLRSKRRLPQVGAIRFVGSFGIVAVALVSVMSLLTPVIAQQLTGKHPNEVSQHIIEMPCTGESFAMESATSCVFQHNNSAGIAILVGDSMAKSLSDGFVEASANEQLTSYVFSHPGCAFQMPDSPFAVSNECIDWRTDVVDALQKLQPKIVMIANLSSLYVEDPLPDWNIDETRLIWGSQFTRTLQELQSLQSRIIVVQAPPKFSYDLRYDISLLRSKSVKELRSLVVSRRATINEIEDRAIAKLGFVEPALNFTNAFCSAELCDPKVNNKFMLEDEDHLSVDGSLFVVPVVQNAIALALEH